MPDLVVTNVLAYRDGEWRPSEIRFSGGKVESVADPAGEAGPYEIRDLGGAHASPGWADLHTHLLPLVRGGIGTTTDKIGPRTGVTALADVGTAGAANFHKLHREIAGAEVPVRVFLNIKKLGIRFWKVGKNEEGMDDIEAMARVRDEYPDLIVGVKVTASKEHMLDYDPMCYVRKAIEAGERLCLPVMVHIGRTPPSLGEILPLMRKGDILTHCFRNGEHHILGAGGRVRDDVIAARERGVLFDVGHGVKSFDFNVAEAAIGQGFTDFAISSDLYMFSTPYRAKSMAHVLSKFLCMGMSLEDVVERASTVPAAILGLRRELVSGAPAFATFFKVVEGQFEYKDCWNNKRAFGKKIEPAATVVDGRYRPCLA